MTEPAGNKPVILIVDDSRLMRVAARKILREDFDILEAGDGEQAWEILGQHPEICLVMSDLSMPELDGLGLLERIRQSERAELPVIIVTGAEDDDGSKQRALAAGASDFITKPFESVQLLARAKTQATQARTREALKKSETERARLHETSALDPETGLCSPGNLRKHAEHDLAFALRHRTELSLLLVRIKKYKVLFLRHGKAAAEAACAELARLLCQGRRREDKAGRIDMDCFALLLPSANRCGARRIAAQLQEAVRDIELEQDGKSFRFEIETGVANPDIRPGLEYDQLIELAQQDLEQRCPENTAPAGDAGPAPRAPAPEEVAVPAVASANDVAEALLALARGEMPGTPTDALARSVLPLIEAWNRTSGRRHETLLNQLREALYPRPAPAPGPEGARSGTPGD